MEFNYQKLAIGELKKSADFRRQSILIEGFEGSGKSYLAGMYAKFLSIPDFIEVQPTVNEIRSTIDDCYQLTNPIVLCIENLDLGVNGASYSLLKFLEEPYPNIFIVVTCRNINRVPDTIVSRSFVITIPNPIKSDIELFAKTKYPNRYNKVRNHAIWKCIHTLKDADTIMMMSDDQLSYFDNLRQLFPFKSSISEVTWKLGHFEDNSETPIELVIRYIMELNNSQHVEKCGIDCIKDLTQGRIAKHAVLAKFCFELKYCE